MCCSCHTKTCTDCCTMCYSCCRKTCTDCCTMCCSCCTKTCTDCCTMCCSCCTKTCTDCCTMCCSCHTKRCTDCCTMCYSCHRKTCTDWLTMCCRDQRPQRTGAVHVRCDWEVAQVQLRPLWETHLPPGKVSTPFLPPWISVGRSLLLCGSWLVLWNASFAGRVTSIACGEIILNGERKVTKLKCKIFLVQIA